MGQTNLELDILNDYYKGRDYTTLVNKFLKRFIIVHRSNSRSQFYLKSNARIKREILRQLNEAPYIINPFSIYRLLWERIMLVVWGVFFIFGPYNAIFLHDIKFQPTDFWFWMEHGLNLVCLVDVVQNFFTGYFNLNANTIVLKQSLIAWNYLKFYFWIDAISSLPYKFLVPRKDCVPLEFCKVDIATALVLLKIFRFVTFYRYIDHLRLHLNQFTCRMLRIFFAIVFTLHWISILQHFEMQIFGLAEFVKNYYTHTENSTSSMNKPIEFYFDETLGIQYSTCLFRAIYVTFHFSHDARIDVHIEDIVVTFILTGLGLLMKIYLLAQILLYIGTFQKSMKYHHLRKTLQEYMKLRQIPKMIQTRFLEYYDFQLQQRSHKEVKIIKNISNSLKQEIILQSCRRLVKALPLFAHLPENLLPKIFTYLETEIFLKDEIILRAGQIGTRMYFIVNGTVAIYTTAGRELAHLKDGEYFGEIALFTRENLRTANVIAVETCDLLTLHRNHFIKVLAPFPQLLNELRELSRQRFQTVIDEEL